MAYDVAPWHDFFLLIGTASAALSGLVFVGLSIHARRVVADDLLRARTRSLTLGIIYVTVAAGMVLIPQSTRALGIEVALGGCALAAIFSIPLVRFSGRLTGELRARTLTGMAACLASAYAGASVAAHGGGGLYVLAASGLVGMTANVLGALSLLLGLARES